MNSSTLTRAVLADAAEVVAAEVDEHHVLGALLGVGEQLLGDPAVLLGAGAARAGAGDRPGRHAAAGDGDQRLGAGAGDLEVAEVEEVHVRARVDRPQPAVDRERLDRHRRRPALRGDHLVGVAGVDVLDDPRDHRLELLARHVRLKRRQRRGPAPGGRAGRGTGPASRQRTSAIVSSAARVGRLEVVVGVDVGEHRDRVLEVVEHDQRVGQHQRQVGHADRVGVRLAERLDGAHEVVGEHADRAAGERRQVRERRGVEAVELRGGERVRVAGIAERPAQHLARAEADERVAPDAALVGRLEQERRVRRSRSFRNADTGVWQSSMNVSRTGIRLCSRASSRTSSSDGRRPAGRASALATAIEHPLGVGERQPAARGAAPRGGRARRRPPRRRARRTPRGRRGRPPRPPPAPSRRSARGSASSARRVGALRPCRRPRRRSSARAPAAPRAAPRLELAAVKAGPLAGVAGGPGRLDQREQRVAVAVVADRLDRLRVPGRRALVPQLLARAAEEVHLARLARQRAAPRRSCTRASAPRRCASPARCTAPARARRMRSPSRPRPADSRARTRLPVGSRERAPSRPGGDRATSSSGSSLLGAASGRENRKPWP